MVAIQSDQFSRWLGDRLGGHAARLGIVGASAAVIHDGALGEAVFGRLDIGTQAQVTRQSLFQLGSITKAFTATLVLQMAEEGRIALDDPFQRHVRDFRVACEQVSRDLMIRQLLTHTNGLDGEFFHDAGSGDDCIQAYMADCRELGQVHAPGESVPYCNAGFVLLGALVERLTGRTWDTHLREALIAPLGLASLTTRPAELASRAIATGHILDRSTGRLESTAGRSLPRAMGPTGATLHGAARDLAAFGRALAYGRALAPELVETALCPAADWPTYLWTGAQMGLGWQLYAFGGRRLFGHDGATFGQASFLRVLPEEDLVLALLTNGGPGKALHQALFDDVFGELGGVKSPEPPVAYEGLFATDRIVGAYGSRLGRLEVFETDGRLMLKLTSPLLAGMLGAEPRPLSSISATACIVEDASAPTPEILVFHHFDRPDGGARLASFSHRDFTRLD